MEKYCIIFKSGIMITVEMEEYEFKVDNSGHNEILFKNETGKEIGKVRIPEVAGLFNAKHIMEGLI